ncbi:lactosylceramide 4-alpha-galactosyltransferase-like [Periplaneta americana]|uniref:lactosylceramide 4-alpha-galactosyltransferase-like n=1 Tax=Periplaneta americana TaxID=6978 RepID=UPI0037E96764
MKRRLKHKIIFVCALVFVLWINSFLYSHYQEARNDSTHEEVYNFPDIEMEPIRGRKNIIFLETLCAISPNEISSTGLLLTKRQACSIESAAKWNPSSTVHLLYTCSMNGGMEVTSSYIRQLFKYPNVKIWKLDIPEFLKGTPLEGWDFHGELSNSKWPVFHASDVLRFVALYKYGGTYLDLDVVIKRSLEELGGNYVGKENPQTLSSCVLSMSAEVIGHEVAKLCVEDTLKDFDGGSWNHNGPDLITKVLKQVCGVDKVEKMSPETCRGFKILSTEVFTPIFYYQWKMLFRSTEIQEVMDLMNLSYGVHMWNFLSNEGNVNLLIQQLYGLLASHHCPLVYSNSDISF